jgi:hypothetical protein
MKMLLVFVGYVMHLADYVLLVSHNYLGYYWVDCFYHHNYRQVRCFALFMPLSGIQWYCLLCPYKH